MIEMNDKYTVTKAVCDVMAEMPSGTELLGYKLHNKIIHKLIEHGSDKRPLDSTTTRLVRKYGELYGVKAVAQGVSKYVKDRLF